MMMEKAMSLESLEKRKLAKTILAVVEQEHRDGVDEESQCRNVTLVN